MAATNTLLCPYLTDEPAFAYGVEFGMLFCAMKRKTKIKGYYLRQNQEQILLLANRLGWNVKKIGRRKDCGKPWEKDWFWLVMIKNQPQRNAEAGG
jgi:hypothetical protein